MGPVVSRQHFDRIQMYLRIAREEGATFLTGDADEQQFQLPEENREVTMNKITRKLNQNLRH